MDLAKIGPSKRSSAAIRATCSLLFLLGSALLFPGLGAQAYLLAIGAFLLGSLGFALDVIVLEPRRAARSSDGSPPSAALASIGTIHFVIGSVACFPSVVEAFPRLGLWAFILGSLAWLASEAIELAGSSAVPGPRQLRRLPGAVRATGLPTLQGIAGCILFIAGCAVAMPSVGLYRLSTLLYVFGSACFVAQALHALLRGEPVAGHKTDGSTELVGVTRG